MFISFSSTGRVYFMSLLSSDFSLCLTLLLMMTYPPPFFPSIIFLGITGGFLYTLTHKCIFSFQTIFSNCPFQVKISWHSCDFSFLWLVGFIHSELSSDFQLGWWFSLFQYLSVQWERVRYIWYKWVLACCPSQLGSLFYHYPLKKHGYIYIYMDFYMIFLKK